MNSEYRIVMIESDVLPKIQRDPKTLGLKISDNFETAIFLEFFRPKNFCVSKILNIC